MDQLELERMMERVESARSRQAVEFDRLFDSVELNGVTFFRPTLAHSWTIAELLNRGGAWSAVERQLVLGYCLTFPADEVGGRFRELLRGAVAELPERAGGFMISHGLGAFEVLPVVEELLGDLTPKKVNPGVCCSPAGGAVRSTRWPPDMVGVKNGFWRFLWSALRRTARSFCCRPGSE